MKTNGKEPSDWIRTEAVRIKRLQPSLEGDYCELQAVINYLDLNALQDTRDTQEKSTRGGAKCCLSCVKYVENPYHVCSCHTPEPSEKERIGKEFWRWFYQETPYEEVEAAIERITGVKDTVPAPEPICTNENCDGEDLEKTPGGHIHKSSPEKEEKCCSVCDDEGQCSKAGQHGCHKGYVYRGQEPKEEKECTLWNKTICNHCGIKISDHF